MNTHDENSGQQLSVTGQRLMAVSKTGALILFFVLGFALHAWMIAWVAFLVPGLVRTWFSIQGPTERTSEHGSGYGIDARTGTNRPYPY